MGVMDLSTAETRVLGCLLEKQRTTPDHYPLSLNSLRLACNQSTNRDPVVDYDEAVVRDALHRLERRGLTRLAGASRAAKYRHLLSQALPMSDAEQAIVCVLMLRGPQTPGELKQRGERIHAFVDLEEVHATLAGLIERGLVARLERRPGQKEERYSQLLGEDAQPEPSVGSFVPAQRAEEGIEAARTIAHTPELVERVERLEREVEDLHATLAQLLERTGFEPSGSEEAAVGGSPAFERVEGDPAIEHNSREADGGQPRWSEEVAQHNP
jgi:uncharacterized protein YceH (UPF0502 family)